MSCELLNPQKYEMGRNFKPVVHDAIHDLDSFMAVFFFLVFTRRGGGGLPREEMSREENKFIEGYFNDRNPEILADAKETLLRRSIYPDENLTMIGQIHDTFATLKPLVRQWAQVLHIAYRYRGWEYHWIHDIILHLFDKAINEAKSDLNTTTIPVHGLAMEARKNFTSFITQLQDIEPSFLRRLDQDDEQEGRTSHGLLPVTNNEVERARGDFHSSNINESPVDHPGSVKRPRTEKY